MDEVLYHLEEAHKRLAKRPWSDDDRDALLAAVHVTVDALDTLLRASENTLHCPGCYWRPENNNGEQETIHAFMSDCEQLVEEQPQAENLKNTIEAHW
jgi:hypothetical protein